MHARDGPSFTVGSVISEKFFGFEASVQVAAGQLEALKRARDQGRAKDASMKQQLGDNCLGRDGRSEESAGTLNMLETEDYFLEREKRVSSLG